MYHKATLCELCTATFAMLAAGGFSSMLKDPYGRTLPIQPLVPQADRPTAYAILFTMNNLLCYNGHSILTQSCNLLTKGMGTHDI